MKRTRKHPPNNEPVTGGCQRRIFIILSVRLVPNDKLLALRGGANSGRACRASGESDIDFLGVHPAKPSVPS